MRGRVNSAANNTDFHRHLDVPANFTGDGSYWQTPPPLPLVPQRFFRVSNP
jgi:hypothetical protein